MRQEQATLPEGATIKIVIDETGDTVVSVAGVKGGSCLAITKPFREATGEVVNSRTTPEYREEASTDENLNRARR